jgi:2-dehydropantoate 2-reductase
MKICLAQLQASKGNVQSNIQHHIRLIKRAIKLNADLIVFPELSITGYEPELAKELSASIEDELFDPFQKLSDQNKITIGVGMPTPYKDGVRISLLIFQPNKNRLVYSKQILHDDELPYFVQGDTQEYITIDQTKIAFGICYESLQREHFINTHHNGAEIYIASVSKPNRGIEKANSHFPSIAKEFNTPVLMANSIGYCDNFMSAGQSAVWNKNGALLAQLDEENEGLILFDTNTETTIVEQINIKKGTVSDEDKLFQIYLAAKAELERNSIFQWTDNYPTKSIIEDDLKKGYLYVLTNGNEIIGAINISEIQEAVYSTVDWQFDDSKILVIHRLVVNPIHQRNGYASKMMDFAEQYAADNSYTSIRLDAYSQNKKVIEFYKKRAYHLRGVVHFPEREFEFYCMEKSMVNKDKSTIKILVVGIGGVGGFFGGLLAKEFENSSAVEIYFLARGAHLSAIKENGLHVKWGENSIVTHPKLATDNILEIGKVDYVLLCTKSYDLETVCHQIAPSIKENTVILPLLNGVNNVEKVEQLFPNNLVLNGCVYIVSSIIGEGQIENSGNIQSLYFGKDDTVNERINQLERLFIQANIEATLSDSSLKVCWEKFIFLASIATATSYFNCTIGELLADESRTITLHLLVQEVIGLAKAKHIDLDADILPKTIQKFNTLPPHITSSLHRDFQNKNAKTELDALTGYVVEEAYKLNCSTPTFKKLYNRLKTITPMNQRIAPIINLEELVQLKNNQNLVLIDARNGKEAKADYAKDHLEGAIDVDLNSQLSNIKENAVDGGRHPLPEVSDFIKTLSELGISTESHVVVYDDTNGANSASRLWWMLRSIGHEKVQVLNGGFQTAIENGFPSNNRTVVQIKAKSYPADKWILPMATMEEVEAVSKMEDSTIIDVRESYRYRGESEPIDPIAGHIPGAINIPLANNLDKNGLFHSPEDLRKQYQSILQNKNADHTMIHCGSGVTACHTILAMDYAGLEIPKLYVGSWSEWCRNDKEIVVEE